MKIINLTIILSAMLGISSCDWVSQSIKETKSGSPATRVSPDVVPEATVPAEKVELKEFAASPEALERAEEAFRNLPGLKGKKIKIYKSIHFYDNHRIILSIQNPDNKRYVDEYEYRQGTWQGPKPVVLSIRENIDKDVVDLDSIPFRNASRVYKSLKEKLKSIGGNTNDITVYVITFNGKIRWHPSSISNERFNYDIEFNTDGSLKSFEGE